MHHGFVHLVSGYAHGARVNDAAHGNHRDVRGAAADVDHHVSKRLFDWQARADRRRQGLLHEIHFAGPRAIRGILTARFSTGVISLGTPMTMRGCTKTCRLCAFWMKYVSIFSVTLKSAITPSFIGL